VVELLLSVEEKIQIQMWSLKQVHHYLWARRTRKPFVSPKPTSSLCAIQHGPSNNQALDSPSALLRLPNSHQSPKHLDTSISTTLRLDTNAPSERTATVAILQNTRATHRAVTTQEAPRQSRIVALELVLVKADTIPLHARRACAFEGTVAGATHAVKSTAGVAGTRSTDTVQAVTAAGTSIATAAAVGHVVLEVVAAAITESDPWTAADGRWKRRLCG